MVTVEEQLFGTASGLDSIPDFSPGLSCSWECPSNEPRDNPKNKNTASQQ
jgi:hypothetical protein